jgi:predicted acyltransferase
MNRSNSLDALRGFAILAMVLSSSIAFGILPGWMYHGQTPPPTNMYNPELPGITWVDLVFPFFLFSMGAAFPLALQRKIKEGVPAWKIFSQILQRYLLLVFFAIFTLHARAGIMSKTPGAMEQLLSIGCFVLLCFMYIRWKEGANKQLATGVRVLAYTLAIAFLVCMPFASGKGFSLDRSDVIIIVLGNMAFFGSLIWWATYNHPWIRIGILPFIMAVFLTGKIPDTWNNVLFTWSPVPWMYKFYYLKYLFIIIPGTFAGEWLLTRMKAKEEAPALASRTNWLIVALIGVTLCVVNLVGLYTRALNGNLLTSFALCVLLLLLVRKMVQNSDHIYFSRLAQAGVYLLLLGLFFEAWEGGIKKDPSTYSYYFVTTGLAFLALLTFSILERYGYLRQLIHFLALNGKNPMVAYTAGNLLLLPVLKLTGVMDWYLKLQGSVWGGYLSGILFTGVVSLITIFFVKRKWFWKT